MLFQLIEIHLIQLEFNKYVNSFDLFPIPGKDIVLFELGTPISSYLKIYRSKGRPPVSNGDWTCSSVELEVGFIPSTRTCPGSFARRRVIKCLSIRELSARHSNFKPK